MNKKPQEWLKQAEYDMVTADAMFKTRRYIYAVFMCHLSIEKALKGLYLKILNEPAPKTHNLLFLLEKTGIELPADLIEYLVELNKKVFQPVTRTIWNS